MAASDEATAPASEAIGELADWLMEQALGDGSALDTFRAIVEEQGGDPQCLDDRSLLEAAPGVREWRADRSGVLRFVDVRKIGQTVTALGGGRTRLGEPIDRAVGVVFLRDEGASVATGDPIAEIHHREGRGLERAIDLRAVRPDRPAAPRLAQR